MRINKAFSLIFMLLILSSCANSDQKLEFKESDKQKMIQQKDIFSNKYLKTIKFKNNSYLKSIDTTTEIITYKNESEIWKNNKNIGEFVSKTYRYPESDLDYMNSYFSTYVTGNNLGETFSDLKFERTDEIELPFNKYRIYKVFKNDTLNIGFRFNILKENKIIFTSFVTNDKFQFQIEKLIEKLNGI